MAVVKYEPKPIEIVSTLTEAEEKWQQLHRIGAFLLGSMDWEDPRRDVYSMSMFPKTIRPTIGHILSRYNGLVVEDYEPIITTPGDDLGMHKAGLYRGGNGTVDRMLVSQVHTTRIGAAKVTIARPRPGIMGSAAATEYLTRLPRGVTDDTYIDPDHVYTGEVCGDRAGVPDTIVFDPRWFHDFSTVPGEPRLSVVVGLAIRAE